MKESKQRYSTTHLFRDIGSYFIGFTSTFKIAGHLFFYNLSESPEEADKKAIKNDWGMVGKDIKSATKKYSEKV